MHVFISTLRLGRNMEKNRWRTPSPNDSIPRFYQTVRNRIFYFCKSKFASTNHLTIGTFFGKKYLCVSTINVLHYTKSKVMCFHFPKNQYVASPTILNIKQE